MMTDMPKKQCFTSIQSRKLLGGLESCQLCPSMDLVVYGTTASASQQSLYRTVSWQKVATIKPPEDSAKSSATTMTCWSPNGRWIVVAADSKVSLYGVEPLANPPGGVSFGGSSTEAEYSWTVSHPIVGLSWAHVGRPHPTAWKLSDHELEEEVSWRYQSHYVDRSTDFLPPSAYHQNAEEDDHQQHHETTTSTALPECKTPLSVLCVSTTQHLEFYLHGRYPFLKLPRSSKSSPLVSASHDLTRFLVHSDGKLSMYNLPFLKRDRYPMQTIASLHSSIMSHLLTLQQSINEVLNSWKSSLKPLDTKLQPLLRLLQNYGVDDQPLGSILKQFILVGHSSHSSTVANAMDQFFTSVQMNDQLLQRMERTLHGSLANVESLARKGLLSPTQALCWQIQELAGLVRFHSTGDVSSLQQLVDASHLLWISVETLLTKIVASRFRVRDLCGWLRSAGSQIKAKGTASQSVQRENARKRRAPQALLERLLAVLNMSNDDKQAGLSEQLLDMAVLDMLKETPSFVSTAETTSRPDSPSSVTGLSNSIPTVAYATNQNMQAAEAVFDNPLSNIPLSIVPTDLALPQFEDDTPALVAIHTRIGRDVVLDDSWQDDEDEDEEECSYFVPRLAKHSHISLPECLDCRQWYIIAQAHGNVVQLYCVPLGWNDSMDYEFDFDDDSACEDIPFYLTTKLVLPQTGFSREIGFYSDDGKSSLSSGNDSGTGKEGRQKLGILFQESEELELWLTTYDSLLWQVVPFKAILMHSSEVEEQCTKELRAMPGVNEDEEEEVLEDDSIAFAQSRAIAGLDDSVDTATKLLLCGSRGVGGVVLTSLGISSLELLDLEEDEEVDDESDGEEA